MRSFILAFFLIFSIYSDNLNLIVAENDPSTLVEGVSVITGDLYSFEEDYVIQGAEPIHLYRSFFSREGIFKDFQHLTATFFCAANTFFVSEHNGASIDYCGDSQNHIFPIIGEYFYGEKKKYWKPLRYNAYESMHAAKGVSNTSSGNISALTNLKNQYIIFDPNLDPEGKSFTFYASNGTRRRYVKHDGQHRLKNGLWAGNYLLYAYKLVSETLPNGHMVHYIWDKENRLTRIYTTNAAQTKIFAQVNAPIYSKPPSEYTLTGSDGRSLSYKVQPTEEKNLFVHTDVTSPDLPHQNFGWHLKQQNIGDSQIKHPYLQRLDLPKKRSMQIVYSDVEDPADQEKRKCLALIDIRKQIEAIKPKAKKNPGKYKYDLNLLKEKEKEIEKHGVPNEGLKEGYTVKTLLAPAGKDETLITTHSFVYDKPNKNSYVLDAQKNKTAYFWNDDYRLTRIQRYVGADIPHSADTFLWENTQLRCKTFYDEKSNPLFSRVLHYDPFGNIKTEMIYGNFSGKSPPLKIGADGFPEGNGVEMCIKKFTYSEDGRNLLLRQEEPSTNLCIKYAYRADSHLLDSKSICEGEQVKIQTTYSYDADLILSRETIEDGIVRVIKKITPLESGPYIGMPQMIEEMYGQETLLRKTVFHYGKGASIEQKDIYDANGLHRYSLKMSYDDKGRLTSETNAIGQKAIYGYDDLGNRTYVKDFSGRLETFCYYDYSNRLIKKEEKGDDGLYRVYTYEYDAKHNLISETDAYNNKTQYILDAFGHRKEVHLPSVLNNKGEWIASITKFQFDSAGNEIEKIDPAGNVTKIQYNVYGKPIHITHPDGGIEEFTYYLDGKLQQHIDAKKVATTYEYDYLGRVVKKTTSDAVETFEYTGQYLTKRSRRIRDHLRI